MTTDQLVYGSLATDQEVIDSAVIAEREACAELAAQVIECYYNHGKDCGCEWPEWANGIITTVDIPRLIRDRK